MVGRLISTLAFVSTKEQSSIDLLYMDEWPIFEMPTIAAAVKSVNASSQAPEPTIEIVVNRYEPPSEGRSPFRLCTKLSLRKKSARKAGTLTPTSISAPLSSYAQVNSFSLLSIEDEPRLELYVDEWPGASNLLIDAPTEKPSHGLHDWCCRSHAALPAALQG